MLSLWKKKRFKAMDKENDYVQINKLCEMVVVMSRWIENLQNNKKLDSYFTKNNYRKIAVYGMSYFSQNLQGELLNTDIIVDLIFDKNSMDEILNHEVDVIVVTSLYYFYEIREQLIKMVKCPIICIDDIIYKM